MRVDPSNAATPRLRHLISSEYLQRAGSLRSGFRLAAEAGFAGIELSVDPDVELSLPEIVTTARAHGLAIPVVKSPVHWNFPLSSPDAATVECGVQSCLSALEAGRACGASILLLVPGQVSADTSYTQAYARSQAVIRARLLPVAQDYGIVIAIENVWNGFLLSPLEYAQYVEDFQSLWLKAYLDVGNVVFGHAENWIDASAPNIVGLHLKDILFDERRQRIRKNRIGAGQIDWRAICAALRRAGYSGWATSAEIKDSLAARILHRGTRELRTFGRSHLVDTATAGVRDALMRRSLEDLAARFDSHVRANMSPIGG